jgi:hypothetical protein
MSFDVFDSTGKIKKHIISIYVPLNKMATFDREKCERESGIKLTDDELKYLSSIGELIKVIDGEVNIIRLSFTENFSVIDVYVEDFISSSLGRYDLFASKFIINDEDVLPLLMNDENGGKVTAHECAMFLTDYIVDHTIDDIKVVIYKE